MRLKTMPVESETVESETIATDPQIAASVQAEQVDSLQTFVDNDSSIDDGDQSEELDDDSPDPNISEELYWAEVKLAGAMAEVERKRSELEDQIGEAKDEVAGIQANLNQHEATLHNLREQLKAQTDILLGLARKLMRVTTGKQLPTEEEAKEPSPADGWRFAKTAELMQGIKGLSKTKLERLAEHADTAGDLQDLRATASQKHQQYHEVMPRGIGAGVAQLIEDRLCEHVTQWMRKTQDPARAKLADDLLTELRSVASEWNQDDCLPKESDDEHVHAGYSAFNEGRSYTEFLSDDRSKSRQWMTGWVGAERLKQLSA